MFDMSNPGDGAVALRVSFWQCVKAGLGFTLGAALLIPAIGAVVLVMGASWATLFAALTSHR